MRFSVISLRFLSFVIAAIMLNWGAGAIIAQEADANELRAAIFRGPGVSDVCANATLEILNAAPDFEAVYVSPKDVQDGVLKDFDVVFFPGGSASAQRRALGEDGWKNLWSFLENGGGYVGTCAGAYLALYNETRQEGRLINAELQEGEWERGEAILEIELTEEGRDIFGDYEGKLDIAYQNGPIFHPADYSKLSAYRVLAFFRSEIAENNAPKGVQINSPAIAVGEYGDGRVVVISPHPELTPSLHGFVPIIARYAAKR